MTDKKRYNLKDIIENKEVVYIEFVSVQNDLCEPTNKEERVQELRDINERYRYIERYGVLDNDKKIRFIKSYFHNY